MGMIELYVKLHPLQNDWNDDLFAASQSSSSSTPPQQSYIVNTLSRPSVQAFIRNILNQEEGIFFSILTDNEDEDDENYNGSEDENEDEDEDEDG
jgi:hypothetical protein